jgi:hypothetical protein
MTEWVHKLAFTGPKAPEGDPAVDAIIRAAEEHGWTFQGAIHSERGERPWGNR